MIELKRNNASVLNLKTQTDILFMLSTPFSKLIDL